MTPFLVFSSGARYKNAKEKKRKYALWSRNFMRLILLPLSAAILLTSADKTKVIGPKMETRDSSVLMKLKDSDVF